LSEVRAAKGGFVLVGESAIALVNPGEEENLGGRTLGKCDQTLGQTCEGSELAGWDVKKGSMCAEMQKF